MSISKEQSRKIRMLAEDLACADRAEYERLYRAKQAEFNDYVSSLEAE